MTYRLVFETTADKRRFVDLAGEEYPSKILDELESAATSGGVVSVRGRALGELRPDCWTWFIKGT